MASSNFYSRQPAPRVIMAERVAKKMAAGASYYPDEETAEALVGLVVPRTDSGEPDIYVLDTIAPDQSSVDRASYMVAQGDDLQDEIMYWLAINWRRVRELRQRSYGNALTAKWDVPLRYLGDWHKQPGEMFWPSDGDLQTALDILHDHENDMPQILAPIVTFAPPWDEETGPPGDDFDLYVQQDNGPTVRINFWYLTRRMGQFVAAKPSVLSNDDLPALPPIGWHLKNRARFQREYDLLSADGLAVSITEWDADGKPPMEVCFMAGRVGGLHVIILVTDINFPQVAPEVRLAPMLKLDREDDLFERLWAESRPAAAHERPDWEWDEGRTLLELVQAVEGKISA